MPVALLNRREFVQKSAVTGAALAVAGAVGSGTAEASEGDAGRDTGLLTAAAEALPREAGARAGARPVSVGGRLPEG
ncbi:twin-arginine translocation signal domain-containing protein [Streptomyces sp. NPDC017435]|uniref:twin-arginine translocation signal domain-containing protein n=1 Tax=Streptomyces sp. NPDC017435 TaxID=3364995 RepID=UPI0037ACEC55